MIKLPFSNIFYCTNRVSCSTVTGLIKLYIAKLFVAPGHKQIIDMDWIHAFKKKFLNQIKEVRIKVKFV